MPVAATMHTAAGAKAFAEFFIKTIDWGYATTSSAYMRHYFEATCVACASAANAIDGAATKHHSFVGDRLTIKSVRTPEGAAAVTTIVIFDVTAGEVLDRHGNYVDADPAQHNFQETISSEWTTSGWRVMRMVPK